MKFSNYRNFLYILILCLLISNSVKSQNISKADSSKLNYYFIKAFKDSLSIDNRILYVDSVIIFSNQINYSKGYIEAHYAKARILKRETKYEEALEEISKGLLLCEKLGEELRQLDLNLESISICLKLNMYDLAISTGKELFQKGLQNSSDSAILHTNIGIAYCKSAKYDKALENYIESLNIHEQLKDTSGIATSLNNIGVIYESQGDLNEALTYYHKSAHLYSKVGKIKNYATILRNIGSTYLTEGNTEDAYILYSKSLQISDSIKDLSGIAKCYQDLAILKQIDENYTESASMLYEAIKYFNLLHDKLSEAKCKFTLAQNLIYQKKYNQAEEILLEILEYSESIRNFEFTSKIYKEISNLYVKTSNFEDAYLGHWYYSTYKDSLLSQANTKELENLKLQYRVRELNKNYKNKLSEQKALSEIELKHQTKVKNIFLIGFALAFILLIWVAWSQFLIRRKNKKLQMSNTIIKTEKHLNQLLLNETLAIFDNNIFGIILTDIESNIIRVNDTFCSISGFNKEQLIGKTADIFYMDEISKNNLRKLRNETFEKKEIFQTQSEFYNKSGEKVLCHIYGRPLNFENPKELLFIVQDKSKEKAIEQQLNIFERFIESSHQGLAMATPDFKVSYINPFLKDLLGITTSAESTIISTYPEEEQEYFKTVILPQLYETGNWKGELKQIDSKGNIIETLENFFIIKDDKGEIIYIADIITDITHIKNTEKALKESNEAKHQLLSIIGHDLRGPVGTLNTFLELILSKFEENDTAKLKSQLNILKLSTSKTYNLLENLLFWARSEKDEMIFNPKEINIKEIIDQLLQLFSSQASQQEIEITSNSNHNINCFADENMLNTILRNLISNALKFTPKDGKIIINAEQKNNEILFSVKDNGIGMPQEISKNLFIEDKIYTSQGLHKEKGTGLGLNLCYKFVNAHNGKIWVESAENVGTCFFFTIPNKT